MSKYYESVRENGRQSENIEKKAVKMLYHLNEIMKYHLYITSPKMSKTNKFFDNQIESKMQSHEACRRALKSAAMWNQ